jgi:Spy/CpxP family protein refolding chaperone
MRGGGGPAAMLLRLVNNPMMRQRVGITTEQAAKIRQQTSDFLKQQIRSRANMQVQRIDLQNLMAAENPDRAAIDKTLEQISALRLAQSKADVDFRLAMRNALTPEQQQKLMQMRQEFMRRGPGGPGRMGPRGPRGMMNRPAPGPSTSQNPPAEN